MLGIELGADDYVTKPFSPREVVARVMAILRRAAGRPLAVADTAQPLRHGHLHLDPDGAGSELGRSTDTADGNRVWHPPHTAAMPSKVFSRDAISDRLHGSDFAITDRTIDSHVRNLRAKFAGFGALVLRVYENSLVRQTEAELVAQGAALAAAATLAWPTDVLRNVPHQLASVSPSIDLRMSRILPEGPAPKASTAREDRALLVWGNHPATCPPTDISYHARLDPAAGRERSHSHRFAGGGVLC